MSDRSTVSHATEARGRRRVQHRRAPWSRKALWVGSLAVSQKQPRADEQAAADAISAVEDLAADPCYEPNGRDTAPDWRLRMTDGRVVDMGGHVVHR